MLQQKPKESAEVTLGITMVVTSNL